MRSKDLIEYRQQSRKGEGGTSDLKSTATNSRPHLSLPLLLPLQQPVNEIRTKCFVHYSAISNYILDISVIDAHRPFTQGHKDKCLSNSEQSECYQMARRNQNYQIKRLNYDMNLLYSVWYCNVMIL